MAKVTLLLLKMIDRLGDAYIPLNDWLCDADAYRAGVDGVPVGAWVHAARQLAANNLNPLFIHCSSFRHFLSHLQSSTNLASSSSHTTLPPPLTGSSLLA